jgi:hypothetical protein
MPVIWSVSFPGINEENGCGYCTFLYISVHGTGDGDPWSGEKRSCVRSGATHGETNDRRIRIDGGLVRVVKAMKKLAWRNRWNGTGRTENSPGMRNRKVRGSDTLYGVWRKIAGWKKITR